MKGGNKFGKPIPGQAQQQTINRSRAHGAITDAEINPLRNKRDVWVINTVPFTVSYTHLRDGQRKAIIPQ